MSEPRVELLVSEWCPTCHQAEQVWQRVAGERAIDFAVVDMGQSEGRELARRLRIRSVPATVIDGELAGVGMQSREQALALVPDAPERAASATRHVGLGLAATSRAAIAAAVVYLVLAGAALPAGGWFAGGPAHPAALHLFTLGFLTFFLYGLGEHMLPRFTGHPLPMGIWSWMQQGVAHAGVLTFALGHIAGWPWLAVAGSAAAWVALALFTGRMAPLLVRDSKTE